MIVNVVLEETSKDIFLTCLTGTTEENHRKVKSEWISMTRSALGTSVGSQHSDSSIQNY